MRIEAILVALAVVGCNGDGPGVGEWESSDVRIDGAGAGDQVVDSAAPQMCKSQNGNIYTVWHDDREGTNDIWFQSSGNGGTSWLTRPIQVNKGQGKATNPQIACLGNIVYVAWEDTSDGELDSKSIFFSRSESAGTTWLDEPIRVDADPDGKYMSIDPKMVAAGDEIHIVWADVVNGAYDIYAASSTTRGASFSAPVRVESDTPGGAYSSNPRVAADGSGGVVVVWEDSRSGKTDIYAAASSDSGATFGADARLDGGDEPGDSDSFEPQIALSGGHAYVVWHDRRNGDDRDVMMNWSADGGATWAAEAIAVESNDSASPNPPGSNDGAYPVVAMNGTVAHIAWQDNRNVGYDVFYRSYQDGAARALEGERAEGEPADPTGELRLDLDDFAGYGNSINVQIDAVEDRVVVAWEDRRNDGYDPTGEQDQVEPQGFNEVVYNFSEDGGLTWAQEDFRIDSYCRGQKYARDIQVALSNRTVVATWRDGRRGNDDLFFGSQRLGSSGIFAPDDVCTAEAE